MGQRGRQRDGTVIPGIRSTCLTAASRGRHPIRHEHRRWVGARRTLGSGRVGARGTAPLAHARTCSVGLGRRRVRAAPPPRRCGVRGKRQPVCKPGSVWRGEPRVTAIHLGRPSPDASCDPPGRLWPETGHRPYAVLLPAGFAVPAPLPAPRWALTPPFHPYRRQRPRPSPEAVSFLWHFPWGCPRRALPGAVFPWSPDFPPRRPFGRCRSGRPTGWPPPYGVDARRTQTRTAQRGWALSPWAWKNGVRPKPDPS